MSRGRRRDVPNQTIESGRDGPNQAAPQTTTTLLMRLLFRAIVTDTFRMSLLERAAHQQIIAHPMSRLNKSLLLEK